MNAEVSRKVIDYVKKKNYVGIVVDKEIQSCGWAGPRESIRGEFVKKEENIMEEIDKFNVQDVDGIKVFVPKHLDNKFIPRVKISSLFTLFGLFMFLNVEFCDE